MEEKEAKRSVVNAGKKLVESGLIARTWGNVSCRISDTQFVITPSGRDYMSLTPEEIVTVSIENLSYKGNIKPSSEKGVHAEVYKFDSAINFVIHTHQENASVISTLGLESVKPGVQYPLLGKEIICAAYGLPGTGKLVKGIAQALRKSSGNTVIMKHHGALCFGINEDEAFMAATQLEEACEAVIAARYLQMKPDIVYDPAKMREFALINMSEKEKNSNLAIRPPYCSSERTKEGFKLLLPEGKSLSIRNGALPDSLPEDAVIHQEIYQGNQKINYILHSDTPYTHTISCAERILYPLVDDFAQLVGTSVRNVTRDSALKTIALKKSSAVFIKNSGAFCCGITKGDALAVSMILEKNSKAYTAGILFGGTKPISLLDRNLMRFVYLKKYSRQMNSAV